MTIQLQQLPNKSIFHKALRSPVSVECDFFLKNNTIKLLYFTRFVTIIYVIFEKTRDLTCPVKKFLFWFQFLLLYFYCNFASISDFDSPFVFFLVCAKLCVGRSLCK